MPLEEYYRELRKQRTENARVRPATDETPPLQIPQQQIPNDIMLGGNRNWGLPAMNNLQGGWNGWGWGWGNPSAMPQMNPFSMYGGQADPFNWSGFLGGFK